MTTVLLPKPRRCRISRRRHDLSAARWILIPPTASPALKAHFAAFAEAMRPTFGRPLRVTAGQVETGPCLLRARLGAKGLPEQGYRLVCGERGVKLEGRDEAGLFYGLQTLRQLMLQTGASVPQAVIEDYPAFAHRGFMLDISRCKVPTMETLYAYIDLLAAHKINHLQLYTEHTFAYSAHETVWRDASPLTAEEVMALDAYCRDRFIELVPNQNSFGHFERWLIHPEYHYLAESPDGFRHPLTGTWKSGSTLKPDRRSLAFLDSLYAELLPNFTSRLFNVGCDETWELGMGRSSRLCGERGTTRVYLDFVKNIERLVARHGRRMMFWGDIILKEPKLVGELPGDIIALDWGYEAGHRFGASGSRFAASGVPFFVCPGTSSWNSLLGRTENCLKNIFGAARSGLGHGAVGMLNTDWGDNGHHQYKPISYIGMLAGAAASWCGRDGTDIVQALNLFVFQDPTGRTGRVLYEMGNLYTLSAAPMKNRTVFNELLFWDMKTCPRFLECLSPKSVRACREELDRLEEDLGGARPGCGDAELVKEELRNAIAMSRHGLDRFRAHREAALDRTPMRRELLRIIGEHERLWLRRNRPGGLHESSARLRELLPALGR